MTRGDRRFYVFSLAAIASPIAACFLYYVSLGPVWVAHDRMPISRGMGGWAAPYIAAYSRPAMLVSYKYPTTWKFTAAYIRWWQHVTLTRHPCISCEYWYD